MWSRLTSAWRRGCMYTHLHTQCSLSSPRKRPYDIPRLVCLSVCCNTPTGKKDNYVHYTRCTDKPA
jgi:hypothetical protein